MIALPPLHGFGPRAHGEREGVGKFEVWGRGCAEQRVVLMQLEHEEVYTG